MNNPESVPKKEDHPIIISIKDIWKSYGNLQVLKGLSLDIFKAETLVILGRSGVGKSVLLKQIIGIETPDKGTIEINGREVAKLSIEKRSTKDAIKIGMLFQGSALFDSLNVAENTGFYLRQNEKTLSEKEIHDRISHALELVGLADVETKMPSELSGGMRKRAALARLVVYRPSILLYDEPTTGLDPMTAMQINDLINKTKEELQATSIVVTHDIRSALEVGDRLAFHHDGKIIRVAPKKEFFQTDNSDIHAFFENAALTENYFKSMTK